MATYPAVIVSGLHQPLEVTKLPVPMIQKGEIRVRVEWVPSSPLDVYQVEAGLMAQFPQSLGDTAAGTVMEVGPEVKHYSVGDRVFGFFFHGEKEKAQQVYVTAPEHLFGRVPEGTSLAAAATIPNNFCTSYFTLSEKLGLELPWPRPASFTPKDKDTPILIWGASSSVGQYSVQILKYWGYSNVIATASTKHHELIKSYGVKHVFDYRDSGAVNSIREVIGASKPSDSIRVFDCVDSKTGSLLPISKIATQPGSIVAAVLPVVVRDASSQGQMELAADIPRQAEWASCVTIHAIAAYGYEANAFLRDNLQPSIMSELVAQGVIKPNKQRVIEGRTMLERAQKGLDILKTGTVSGERLVWKVWTEEEFPEFK